MVENLSDAALDVVVAVALGDEPYRAAPRLCRWLADAAMSEQARRLRQRRGQEAPLVLLALPDLRGGELQAAADTAVTLEGAVFLAPPRTESEAALRVETFEFFRALTRTLIELAKGPDPSVRPC